MKKIFWRTAFGLYILAVVYVFISTHIVGGSSMSLWEHIRFNSNFIPFKTVWDYAMHIKNGTVNFRFIFRNLMGNLILFLPLGGFLPIIFEKLRSFKRAFLVSLAVIFSVELSQMLLKYGRFDVDDIILNAAGAAIGYLIWKLFDRLCTAHKLKYI